MKEPLASRSAGGDELAGLGVVEAVERDALEARVAVQAGEQRGELVRAVLAGRADGAEHEQPRRLDVLQQVAEQQRRGRVRPLQVVEDEHRRGVGGHAGEHARDGFEQAVAAGLAVLGGRLAQLGQMAAERGHEAGELAQLGGELGRERERVAVRHEVLDGGHERLVRDERLGVVAAVQDGRAGGVRLAGELGGQARLADARVAARAAPSGARPSAALSQRARSRVERFGATDERAALELAHEHALERDAARGGRARASVQLDGVRAIEGWSTAPSAARARSPAVG